MNRWPFLVTFLVGRALGVAGTILGPRYAGPYLPEAMRGKVERLQGAVVRKQREQDRLLLTVVTAQGAILGTFKQRVAEIDLLVAEGDPVTLALPRYKPFVEDPTIERVQKGKKEGDSWEGPPR